jgi:hypothetical protein
MFEFIVSSLLFMLILQGQASAAGLTGSWDCLGSVIFSGQQTLSSGQVVVNTFQENQLIHLGPFNADGVANGTFSISGGAEICTFAITATAAPNPAGQGKMTLSFPTPGVPDIDKDVTNCGQFFFGESGPFTANYLISSVIGSKKFFFLGSDDFLSPSTRDNRDYFSQKGECDQD